MAKTCPNCGAVVGDDVMFCTECGTALAAPAPVVEPAPVPAPQPEPVEVQPVEVQPVQEVKAEVKPAEPKKEEPKKRDRAAEPVKTAAFFWLQLLFALPFIGWLIALIVALAAKKKSLKNYATSVLIWVIVGLVIAILVAVGAFLFYKIGLPKLGIDTSAGFQNTMEALIKQFLSFPVE